MRSSEIASSPPTHTRELIGDAAPVCRRDEISRKLPCGRGSARVQALACKHIHKLAGGTYVPSSDWGEAKSDTSVSAGCPI